MDQTLCAGAVGIAGIAGIVGIVVDADIVGIAVDAGIGAVVVVVEVVLTSNPGHLTLHPLRD